ncbi:hypothetical protein KC332_g7806 [Hortaea werneckii]|nr:hypothetical protein KC358_g10874 [Hortaea werneckii]KAI6833001.1 hypothetical protein KC350_g7004 [Hortaea werneckii]KAI6928977.1 hypothetical protein KC348_g7977 [Hortaea werneckii]KAI6929976.1 hypothetical protein KC341_g10528 [Hortaea werneckii]KAI6964054.1 hypothetical protein KC321_g10886 [Hortaea werneckii]
MERHDSGVEHKNAALSDHYNDWPNAAGFNATEIAGDRRHPIRLGLKGYIPAFDGFTTTHKFELIAGQDGVCDEIWYSSRCQVDELLEQARNEGRLDSLSFGQKRDPCDTFYKKLKSAFVPATPQPHAAVAIRPTLPSEETKVRANSDHDGRLLTLTTDNATTKQFDFDTLEPIGIAQQDNLHPSLIGPMSAAHASHDPVTGETFNYNLAFGRIPAYRVFRTKSDGTTEILAQISGNWVKPAYLHSLALTPSFVILCVWPAFFKSKGIDILWHRNLFDAMEFAPGAKTKWYVVDRHHNRGVVKTFESPSFFCFHTTNAWEEERVGDSGSVDLTCELVEFANMDILHRFYYTSLVSDQPHIETTHKQYPNTKCSLVRYKLEDVPLQKATKRSKGCGLAKKTMVISAGDLPQFNQEFVFKPHRFVYSVLNRGKSSFQDGLAKTDTATGEMLVWETLHHTPGEPVFISKPGSKDEDDGAILSVVLDGDSGESYLLCLDARSFAEIGRAEIGMPVGFGFHGAHFPKTGSEVRPSSMSNVST